MNRFNIVGIFWRTMLFNLGFGCLAGSGLVTIYTAIVLIALPSPIVLGFLLISLIFLIVLLGLVNLVISPANAVLIISARLLFPASAWLKKRYRIFLLGTTMTLTFVSAFTGYRILFGTDRIGESPAVAYLLYGAMAGANGVASVLASQRVLRWYVTEYLPPAIKDAHFVRLET
jgi:hypothetical protein